MLLMGERAPSLRPVCQKGSPFWYAAPSSDPPAILARAKVKSDAWLAKKEAEAEEAEAARIKAPKAQDSQSCAEHGNA